MPKPLAPEIRERVIELKTEWLTNRKIKEKVMADLGENISLGAISNLTSEMLKDEMKEKLPDRPKYKVREIDGEMHYVFEYKNKVTEQREEFQPQPIEKIKSIVYDFSKHWWDLTQQEILEKYELNWNFWTTIKSRLNLWKYSNVIDPVSLEVLESKWQDAVNSEIEEMTDQAVVDKYKKKWIRQYQTALEKNAIASLKREGTREAIIDWVEERVKKMWLPKLPPLEPIKAKPGDWTIETITDLHIGKNGSFAIFDHLDSITQTIIDKPQKEVYLELLWDLWEIFVEWWRHPGQIEWMEWKYWFDLIMQVVEVLTRFIYAIWKHKVVHVIGIWWNHDVFSTAKEWDQARTAALVCYTMIKERLRDQKNISMVIPREPVYVYYVWKLCNILAHGEEISRKTLPHIIIEFWDTSLYNVVKHWHLHFTHLKETSDKGLMLWCPGLAGKWDYDKRKVLSSSVWHVSMEDNPYSKRKMPKIDINLL